jgi:GT2 family glycosyltransferase
MTPTPSTQPEISIVLGAYNRRRFLVAAIESIRGNGITVPYEIIVVDGGSTDGSLAWLARQRDVITIIQHNRGVFRGRPIPRRSWGYFMNLGFKAAQGKYILMISDDCLLAPGTVMNGYRHFEELLAAGEQAGALAFYWRNWPAQQEYRVGLTLGDKLFVNHGMYLRAALEQVGWIDEEHYRFYHADGDLCLKLWRQGYTVLDCPTAFVEHFVHANHRVRQSNVEAQERDFRTYCERWTGVYYDPQRHNIGDWRLREYADPYHTALRFPWIERIRLRWNTRLRALAASVRARGRR